MPAKLKLDVYRSMEVELSRLSPRYGCGLMLKDLPAFGSSDALTNVMTNYGYARVFADRPAQKLVTNPGLAKPFYDNAFNQKMALRQNFRTTFGHLGLYLAHDAREKSAWFIADAQNRAALVNYYRDAVSLGFKASGILLTGSVIKLTPVGWQNLHDLLSDKFVNDHAGIQRVEVMSVLSGVRWRAGILGLGVTLLNFREPAEIQNMVDAAFRGEGGGEIQG
jgi:hypothetical protein